VPVRENLTVFELHVRELRKAAPQLHAIFGGFAQGAGIAGGAQVTTADEIPHLQLRANFLTSTKLDDRIDFEAVLDTNENRNHVDAWFSYMKRENDFFGIGPRTSGSVKATFETDQRSYQASFQRDFTARFKGGAYAQSMNTHSSFGSTTGTAPITENYSGNPAGIPSQWLPGFLTATQILSYGVFVEYDARDNSLDLTRGLDIYGRVASSDGMKKHAAYADYGWLEGEFDVRGYIPLGTSRTSLALRSRGQFKNPRGGSQIPFYDLSFVGGREFVRGYASYRFRGDNVLIGSAELRHVVLKKTDRRGVDIFGFVDSGQAWGDARSRTDPAILANQMFSSSNWRSGAGGGVEYRHSSSLAARIEAGRSNEGAKAYVSVTRGF
jgi:outer membrane protein assembly factor BamA